MNVLNSNLAPVHFIVMSEYGEFSWVRLEQHSLLPTISTADKTNVEMFWSVIKSDDYFIRASCDQDSTDSTFTSASLWVEVFHVSRW